MSSSRDDYERTVPRTWGDVHGGGGPGWVLIPPFYLPPEIVAQALPPEASRKIMIAQLEFGHDVAASAAKTYGAILAALNKAG